MTSVKKRSIYTGWPVASLLPLLTNVPKYDQFFFWSRGISHSIYRLIWQVKETLQSTTRSQITLMLGRIKANIFLDLILLEIIRKTNDPVAFMKTQIVGKLLDEFFEKR